jgi:TPR repeat protein
MFLIGLMFERGDGVVRNPEAARQWWERAAESGSRMAFEKLQGRPDSDPPELSPY